MGNKRFTNELKRTFEYIKDNILKEYDSDKISTEYFIVSVLENDFSIGNKVLSKIMLHDSMEGAKAHFYEWLSQNARNLGYSRGYDDVFEKSIKKAKALADEQNSKAINSGHVLLSILSNNEDICKYFKSVGVTIGQVNTQVVEETNGILEEERRKKDTGLTNVMPVKHVKKQKAKVQSDEVSADTNASGNIEVVSGIQFSSNKKGAGECEKYFTNLNNMAVSSQVDKVYGNKTVYEEIFTTLSKRNKNNVVIVGKSGVGKTATVRNLANLIVNGEVPKQFSDKVLLEFDFNSLFSGTTMRGVLEARMKAIIADADSRGNYIFFIDSIDNVLSGNPNENDLGKFIESVMNDKNIMLVCTCSEKGYTKSISDYPEWERHFDKIILEEPNDEECIEILRHHAEKLGYFHNVKYDESVFETCVKFSKRYITERNLPDSAIDILDRTGAKISLNEVESDNIVIARKKLSEVKNEKERLKRSTAKKDYNKLDKLEKEEIELKSVLDFAIKSYNLKREPIAVTENDIKKCIAEKTGIEMTEMSTDDRERLKGLNDRVKNVVIGQDEAVDSVCMAIKRKRVGIGNPDKPIVFLMAGSTGVGKSYLAKTIAREIFGSEDKLVRLDMAEYADKTAVNKILGSSAGYVGYDNGGILTEAIKRQKHCVLLLDEIEKADEEIHNTFLSLFDEGRLTDNKGITVDFKNVIVVMTSNIGAKELEERGDGIGFVKNSNELKKEIIEKEIKRKFKPEFINRIDKIIYFNKLTEENIKSIIKLELNKVKQRIENIGYHLNDEILEKTFLPIIYNNVCEKRNMGARPIAREIQIQLEDKLTDFIINNDVKKGYTFTENDLLEM